MKVCVPPTRLQRRGVAATEFALALPLLMLLALGAGDFARVFYFREGVSNAARVGADLASSRGFTPFTRSAWESDVRQAVLSELANLPNFNAADVAIDLTVEGSDSALFEVAIEVRYPFHSAIAWPGLPQAVVIEECTVMKRYR